MKVGACAQSRVREGLLAVSLDYHHAVKHTSWPAPLQIMWPDDEGRFPDEPGSDRRYQPNLARRR
jgi:hypothetical protein